MDITGFEGLYTIDRDGKIFSNYTKKYLVISLDALGYAVVCLSKDKKQYKKKIHRLIAEHYIPNPENKPEVDHINRDRSDHRIENLRWATTSENAENRSLCITNTLKEQYISPHHQGFRFIIKRNGIKHIKRFKTLQEALEYKKNYLDNKYNV